MGPGAVDYAVVAVEGFTCGGACQWGGQRQVANPVREGMSVYSVGRSILGDLGGLRTAVVSVRTIMHRTFFERATYCGESLGG